MKLTDLTQIAVWAGISTTVGLAVLGGRTAVSGGVAPEPPQATAAVGNCRVTASSAPLRGSGSAAVKVSIANPGAKPETVSFEVNVVEQRFTGSLVSRVPSANDIQTATILHREIQQTVEPASTVPVDILVPSSAFAVKTASPPPRAARQTRTMGKTVTVSAPMPGGPTQAIVTYTVEVSVKGKKSSLASFSMQNA